MGKYGIAADPRDTEMADEPRDPVLHAPTELENLKTFECEGNQPEDALDLQNRSKGIRGVEANYALKLADNPPKRLKLDEYEVAMLGKSEPANCGN